MSSRLRIKIGNSELEYEGNVVSTTENVLAILDIFEKLAGPEAPQKRSLEQLEFSDSVQENALSEKLNLHVNSIAAALSVNSGTDLIIACAASLQIVEEKQSFNRTALIGRMKEATQYHKDSYVSNLSSYLKTLISNQKLNQLSKDNYALTAAAYSEVKSKLRD